MGEAVAVLVGHLSCDSAVMGLSPGWSPPDSGLGEASYSCVLLSPSST